LRSNPLVERLASDFTEPVRDPVWGSIYLSPALERLVASPPFAKLSGVRQLGPAHFVYPGATHTRYAHSLGVFHTARRLAAALAARGSLGFVSAEGLSSFLVAALCHDLGHFPFAHSLKELPLAEHEALGARLLLEEPLRSLAGLAGADPEAAAAIVDPALPAGDSREIAFFRGALSGVLDPDKLDYLNRDAYFCGVPYGAQDTDYVLQRAELGPGDRIGVGEKGLMSVEGLLFAKYLMYRAVYWHKGVRAPTAMVKKAVLLALRDGVLEAEELYGLDDAGFFGLLRARARERGFPPFALAEAVLQGQSYPVLLDLPFDGADPRHRALLGLEARLGFEEELAARISARGPALGPLDLIVDIPEPVSFESDLPVLGEEGEGSLPFSESSTVFSPAVVSGFTRALRRIRVLARLPSEAAVKAAREALG